LFARHAVRREGRTLVRAVGEVVRDFNYDLARILRAEPAQAVARSIEAAHCHCTHECYAMTNILFNPRQYPALLKEYLQL